MEQSGFSALIDAYRADTVRILDFYHAAEYVSTIAELVRNAGHNTLESWLQSNCMNSNTKVLKKY